MVKASIFFIAPLIFFSTTYAIEPVTLIGTVAAGTVVFTVVGTQYYKRPFEYHIAELSRIETSWEQEYKSKQGYNLERCEETLPESSTFIVRKGPSSSPESVSVIGLNKHTEMYTKVGSSKTSSPDSWKFIWHVDGRFYTIQKADTVEFLTAYERHKRGSASKSYKAFINAYYFPERFVLYCRTDGKPGKFFRLSGTDYWLTSQKEDHTLRYIKTLKPKTYFTLVESSPVIED